MVKNIVIGAIACLREEVGIARSSTRLHLVLCVVIYIVFRGKTDTLVWHILIRPRDDSNDLRSLPWRLISTQCFAAMHYSIILCVSSTDISSAQNAISHPER